MPKIIKRRVSKKPLRPSATFQILPSIKAKIEEYSKINGVRTSFVVERALSEFFERESK